MPPLPGRPTGLTSSRPSRWRPLTTKLLAASSCLHKGWSRSPCLEGTTGPSAFMIAAYSSARSAARHICRRVSRLPASATTKSFWIVAHKVAPAVPKVLSGASPSAADGRRSRIPSIGRSLRRQPPGSTGPTEVGGPTPGVRASRPNPLRRPQPPSRSRRRPDRPRFGR